MEQVIPSSERTYTEEEYLRLERSSDRKHEFRRGRIIAMAGGKHRHGQIPMNLGASLVSRVATKGFAVQGSDVGVRIARTGSYAYPDLSVVCGDPIYQPPEGEAILVNPLVIVEVLSPSTQRADFGEKFDDYMTVASLQEYVLIDQDRPWARSFHRGAEGMWGIGPLVERMDGAIRFRSLDVEVPLAAVYNLVRFPSPDAAE